MSFQGYYDIVLGDVGRLASVRCMQLMTEFESRMLQNMISKDTTIFDEMRRIMFVLSCEVGWLKQSSIELEIKKHGEITRDVLIGIGGEDVEREFADSGSMLTQSLLSSAVNRGYKRIRVYVPCNGLSELLREIVERSTTELSSILGQVKRVDRTTFQFSNGVSVRCESVPERVSEHICNATNATSALIIGTSGVNDIYRHHLSNSSVKVFQMSSIEYDLVNDAIVAALSYDADRVSSARDELQAGPVRRFLEHDPNGIVVEACTDFDFGIGLSSLSIFAKELVADAYRLGTIPKEA